jgi:hypothetical protein
MTIRHVDPKDVIFIQSRAGISPEIVTEYTELMQEGVTFEPAQGIEAGNGALYVWDGSHRGEAARRSGRMLAVRVEPAAGSRRSGCR